MSRKRDRKPSKGGMRSQPAGLQRPALAVRAQAADFGLAALTCGVICLGACIFLEGEARLLVAILAGIGALPGLLVWGTLLWLSRSLQRDAQELMLGSWKTRWVVPEPDWQEFVVRERRRYQWVVPVVAAFGAAFGSFVGYVLVDEKALIGDSIWLTYTVSAVAGGMLGGILGAFFQRINRRQFQLASSHSGIVLFGDNGYYMPGEYRPWRSFGQHLSRAAVSTTDDGQPPRLMLVFKVKSKYGYVDVVAYAPIPSGKEADAERIVAWLNDRFGS